MSDPLQAQDESNETQTCPERGNLNSEVSQNPTVSQEAGESLDVEISLYSEKNYHRKRRLEEMSPEPEDFKKPRDVLEVMLKPHPSTGFGLGCNFV